MATLAERMAVRKTAKKEKQNPSVKTAPDTSPDKKASSKIKKATPPPRTESSTDIIRRQQSEANVDRSVRYIDLDLIDTEKQVRGNFDEEYIMDLAIDFAESEEKQPNNPITVFEKEDGRFLLSTGENRTRAMLYARDNRSTLNVVDITAFTQIRATIKGLAPESKIDRTQFQVKENVMRDDLNAAELGYALLEYFEANPDASQTDAAKWCGFKNSNSGRVKVNNALKLMKIDKDLIDQVAKQTLSPNKAFKINEAKLSEAQQEKNSPVTTTTNTQNPTSKTSTPKKKKSEKIASAPKKQQTVNVPLETAAKLSNLLNWAATQQGLETIKLASKPNRKEVIDAINSDLLDLVMETIED